MMLLAEKMAKLYCALKLKITSRTKFVTLNARVLLAGRMIRVVNF